MTADDFSADLEYEHRLIDAGIEAYLATDGRPTSERRDDLTRALHALRRHIFFEEEYLFPPLRALGLVGPLAVMVHEHGVMWAAISELEAHLDGLAHVDPGLCQNLLRQLSSHNGKEEAIVYTQARELLPEADQAELSALVTSAVMPTGWTSQATGVH